MQLDAENVCLHTAELQANVSIAAKNSSFHDFGIFGQLVPEKRVPEWCPLKTSSFRILLHYFAIQYNTESEFESINELNVTELFVVFFVRNFLIENQLTVYRE